MGRAFHDVLTHVMRRRTTGGGHVMRSTSVMKHRGSVWGRVGAGTGSGPGMEMSHNRYHWEWDKYINHEVNLQDRFGGIALVTYKA